MGKTTRKLVAVKLETTLVLEAHGQCGGDGHAQIRAVTGLLQEVRLESADGRVAHAHQHILQDVQKCMLAGMGPLIHRVQ